MDAERSAIDEAPARCSEFNYTFERQCEQEAGHDGWHGFMWNWNRPDEGANWWPGPSRP